MAAQWLAFIPTVVEKISDYFSKKQEQSVNAQLAEAKLKKAKQEGQTSVLLSDAESEALMSKGMNNTWKDEYGLILATSPIVIIIAGTILFAFTGDDRLLRAGVDSIKNLNDAGVEMGFIMTAAFCMALGYKIWRKK